MVKFKLQEYEELNLWRREKKKGGGGGSYKKLKRQRESWRIIKYFHAIRSGTIYSTLKVTEKKKMSLHIGFYECTQSNFSKSLFQHSCEQHQWFEMSNPATKCMNTTPTIKLMRKDFESHQASTYTGLWKHQKALDQKQNRSAVLLPEPPATRAPTNCSSKCSAGHKTEAFPTWNNEENPRRNIFKSLFLAVSGLEDKTDFALL